MERTLIIAGEDVREKYGLVLSDEGQILNPPPYKRHYVDVPGMDGGYDLTEAIWGDVCYDNRPQSLVLGCIYPKDFEGLKARFVNDVHGKAFDYQFSFDIGYVFHGRFDVVETYAQTGIGYFEVNIIADPYKIAEDVTLYINAIRGAAVELHSGRKPVCPTFETKWPTNIEFQNETYKLSPGTTRIRDIWLEQGTNAMYINAMPEGGSSVWEDLQAQSITWGEFATKRVIEWRWGDEVPEGERLVYIHYERGDL